MRRVTTGIVLAIALHGLGAAACGGRTGLVSNEPEPRASDASAGSVDGSAIDGGERVYCSMFVGPMPSSGACVQDLSCGICDPHFPSCVELGDRWECCNGTWPYNGPSGGCELP
jgi:hypothetical protein